MTMEADALNPDLNDCGCCEGLAVETPVEVFNNPGLSAIAYRIGTHDQFKQSMAARLSASAHPALRGLRTRDEDDLSIALLDAWAAVADVLTFYQERIANESYLRTASERLSLLEMARLIGYELRPGVAASAYLAFTVDDGGRANIDAGAAVKSLPGPDEKPQTFETAEKIEARAEWNAIRPRLTKPQDLSSTTILLKGTNLNLQPGDGLLMVAGDVREFRRMESVVVDEAAQQTRVDLEPATTNLPAPKAPKPPLPSKFSSTLLPLTNDAVNQLVLDREWPDPNLAALARIQGWPIGSLFANIKAQLAARPITKDVRVFAFRVKASLFGYNAPDWNALPDSIRNRYDPAIPQPPCQNTPPSKLPDWPFTPPPPNQLDLDSVYKGVVPGSWVVVTRPNAATCIAQADSVAETAAANYTMTAKISSVVLQSSPANPACAFPQSGDPALPLALRQTTVYAQSEELEPAEAADATAIKPESIQLDSLYEGLSEGRAIAISGERQNPDGEQASETAVISRVLHNTASGHTQLVLAAPLQQKYKIESVTINVNVALATHGETTTEVLGGGDSSMAFQRLPLREKPLTYVSATTPSGAETTLQVRVNDVLWHEAPSLFGHGPRERIYTTRRDDDGKTTIQFGDAQTGARLPTGQENVTATYRKGVGREGLVKAGQLSLLMTRALGVKGVTNPNDAAGAQDPESRDDAKRNAPLTVLTLDRIVSLRDYEDFARTYAGVAKALAAWTWNGRVRGIFLTVAGPLGASIEPGSTLYQNLLAALRRSGDPDVPIQVQSYRPALFRLDAGIGVDPDYRPDLVLPAVEQALRARFSFDAREFGQGVAASQVIAAMQAVAGVTSVDLNKFFRVGENEARNSKLTAASPQSGAAVAAAAELLTLDPGPVALEVIR